MSKDAQSLEDRVFAELLRRPGMKVRDVAERLGVDRRDVVRCLAYELAGKFQGRRDRARGRGSRRVDDDTALRDGAAQ